jgi:hypothetical protein
MLPSSAQPISGFPGYFVDAEGQVWSTKKRDGSIGGAAHRLKPSLSDGYRRVTLCGPDRKRRFFVHRLVAHAFLGACPPDREVAHLNGVRTDNSLSNLRYVTRTENNHHKYGHGTMLLGNRHPRRSIEEATAKAIGERLRTERSYRRIAVEFGTTVGVVSQIAIGRTWRHVFPAGWKPPARPRLTGIQRAEVRHMAASGQRQSEIAAVFGVTQSAISRALKPHERK